MKFTAVTLEGRSVTGIGIADAKNAFTLTASIYADGVQAYGTEVSILFQEPVDWCGGREFDCMHFELVYTKSIAVHHETKRKNK